MAQPAGIVFDSSGRFMYVASFGTDRIGIVAANVQLSSLIEVAPPSGAGSNVDPRNKRGPRGLALQADGRTLYALNRISNTISVVDTISRSVVNEIAAGTDLTPAVIKNGRGFLYDAKLSGSGTGSCASCHVDAEMDHLDWDLGDPGGNMSYVVQGTTTIPEHPMKGPMLTQSLRGLFNLSPYHWRADRANLAAFNPAFASLMGGNQLSSSDMQAYSDFLNTILYQPNPYENLDRTPPTSLAGGDATAGQNTFINSVKTLGPAGLKACNGCHLVTPAFGPGTNRLIDIPSNRPQQLKNPQLRNVYQRQLFCLSCPTTIDGFALNHDGRTDSLNSFLKSPAFSNYTAVEKTNMSAYVLALDTGTAPAVGYARTLTAGNVTSSSVQSDWSALQSQAQAGNIDLIGRGTLNGQVHGLLYQPTPGTYVDDTQTSSYTQAQLQTMIQSGDTLTFMGVYPGTGRAK
jgi:YVTN family beta-propeller protein